MGVFQNSKQMVKVDKVTIKEAGQNDLPQIFALMAANDMVGDFDVDGCYVVYEHTHLVGFIRVEVVDHKAYIRPIVVNRIYRKQGIGLRLIEKVKVQYPTLVIISRGNAIDFYQKSGFNPIDWGCISERIQNECALCPNLNKCQPIPMIWR